MPDSILIVNDCKTHIDTSTHIVYCLHFLILSFALLFVFLFLNRTTQWVLVYGMLIGAMKI